MGGGGGGGGIGGAVTGAVGSLGGSVAQLPGKLLQAPGQALGGLFGGGMFGNSSSSVNTAGIAPKMEAFKSIADPSGNLGTPYTLQAPGAVNANTLNVNSLSANTDSLNALKSRAMSSGDSPWLQMELQRQGIENTANKDKVANQVMSSNAAAQSNLAMQGGLSSGARERLARGGAQDLNAARQGLGRDAQLSALGARLQDDNTKMGILSQLPSQDLNFANQKAGLEQFNANATNDMNKFNTTNTLNTNQFNTSNAIAANKDLNSFNAYKYAQDMAGYGAAKQGDAIANGGKK